MKTERRHELQTNDLSQWINHTTERLRPYASTIAGAALALLAVLVIWQVWQGLRDSRRERSWSEFLVNQEDPDALQGLGKIYPNEPAGAWAMLVASDAQLREAQFLVYSDRERAKPLLEQAISGFDQALKFAGTGSARQMMRVRALYGLAQANETYYALENDSARLEQAKTLYRRLEAEGGDNPLAEAAKERLASLSSPETQKFYAWFSKAAPVSRDQEGSPASPFDLRSLPGAPDAPLPQIDTPELPDVGQTSAAPETPESTPALGAEPKADAPPAATSKQRELEKPTTNP